MLLAEAVYQRLTSVLASHGLELKHQDEMSPEERAFAVTPAGKELAKFFRSESMRDELAEAIQSATTQPLTAKTLAGQLSSIKCLGIYVDLRKDGSITCDPTHVTRELADQILGSTVRLIDADRSNA